MSDHSAGQCQPLTWPRSQDKCGAAGQQDHGACWPKGPAEVSSFTDVSLETRGVYVCDAHDAQSSAS